MILVSFGAATVAGDSPLIASSKSPVLQKGGWKTADRKRPKSSDGRQRRCVTAPGLRKTRQNQDEPRAVDEVRLTSESNRPGSGVALSDQSPNVNPAVADSVAERQRWPESSVFEFGDLVEISFENDSFDPVDDDEADRQNNSGVTPAPEQDTFPDLPPLTPDIPVTGIQTLPLEGHQDRDIDVKDTHDGLLTITVHDAPLRNVIAVLARSEGLSILMTDDVDTRISGTFNNITFQEAMDAIFSLTDATWTLRGNVILVTKLGIESRASPAAQGRMIRVFTLNYVAAADVQEVVSTLLSSSGRIAINEGSSTDSRKTRERVIVDDVPDYLDRIETYIKEVDQPPLQVLIEAHILQVTLKNDSAHGVDFARLGRIAGVPISISTPGFNGTVTDLSDFSVPSYSVALLEGNKSSALIDVLKKTTDAKTLAAPKVMALNGQEARVQIGEKLGYFVTTSTDTASLQSVEFLETGVVLKVTPRITDDGFILMEVMPEVSHGSVDALGLPSERTTEVATTLMLADGMGMVIGGLIKESDIDTQQRIPVLGSLWGIGKLFRRKQLIRERSEIIIALVPHIVQCSLPLNMNFEFEQATTPLLHGSLEKMPRPWEPQLPDAVSNPRRIDIERVMKDIFECETPGSPGYYFPPKAK